MEEVASSFAATHDPEVGGREPEVTPAHFPQPALPGRHTVEVANPGPEREGSAPERKLQNFGTVGHDVAFVYHGEDSLLQHPFFNADRSQRNEDAQLEETPSNRAAG
uniref:Uncharacterized protein n=1 Tax=Chromera velia CCMP2878 TaxID=1169474 RepID=A0A0G4I4J9_9ALVE|eukprot:Cvel_10934.t1-p1 / transcript=Cvel_10934.t1 / gene=Cvel_10934 / organism=Chromera_velia_CCMP2878 / gene_product=hypothetical protein / transcript_product=hypothetical protein / location=Cvel_scaffold672:44336-44653(-) / protein_length=106 / sequence_SO=supercontig / SO=protein_coding / is_pseudo=false